MRKTIVSLMAGLALAAPAAGFAQSLDQQRLDAELRMQESQRVLREYEMRQQQIAVERQVAELEMRLKTEENQRQMEAARNAVPAPVQPAPVYPLRPAPRPLTKAEQDALDLIAERRAAEAAAAAAATPRP